MANRTLIAVGILLVAAGVAWPFVVRGISYIWNLPGNFQFHKGEFHFYFPLTFCLILSVIISVILMIVKR